MYQAGQLAIKPRASRLAWGYQQRCDQPDGNGVQRMMQVGHVANGVFEIKVLSLGISLLFRFMELIDFPVGCTEKWQELPGSVAECRRDRARHGNDGGSLLLRQVTEGRLQLLRRQLVDEPRLRQIRWGEFLFLVFLHEEQFLPALSAADIVSMAALGFKLIHKLSKLRFRSYVETLPHGAVLWQVHIFDELQRRTIFLLAVHFA